jgi:hypothetical protein
MLGKGVAILLISFPLPARARGQRRARQSGFNIGCLQVTVPGAFAVKVLLLKVARLVFARIPILTVGCETSDSRHRQCLCGRNRDPGAPEIRTHWMRYKNDLFSSPSRLLAGSRGVE